MNEFTKTAAEFSAVAKKVKQVLESELDLKPISKVTFDFKTELICAD